MRRIGASMAAIGITVGLLGCSGSPEAPDEAGTPVLERKTDPALRIERDKTQVRGQLTDNGIDVQFSSVESAQETLVKVSLDGMVLSARYTGDQEILDGVSADGSPTLLTEIDRAAIRRLLAALETTFYPPVDHVESKEDYDRARQLTKAEERLFRVVDAQWSLWPSSVPLNKTLTGEAARSWTSWRRYAATNTTVTGCHDCNKCSWTGDCCDTGKKLGENFNGSNYGNCGTSSTGSQFTKDCTNHDQCVRTTKHGGHALASAYCDDQFTSCIDDEASAPSCDYDWRGTSRKGNCPTSWKGDGKCDCFCQFQDTDC
ncbi:hypothetical protein LZC95_19075 [Pendulispora brunnea]|uniref:Lipoprotein n=1 Tax=Pendulispora brunnea TaxID=2905690 RepID=A0ABZ2KJR1_9BACT